MTARQKITVHAFVAGLFAFSSIMTFASGAGSEGGNGGGTEIEFVSIRSDLNNWLTARLNDGTLSEKLLLSQSGISADVLYAQFLKFKDTPVSAQDAAVAIPGYSSTPVGRICANEASPAHIVCNNANWALATPQIKYAIVLHEILGVAGLEKNQGEYSQYPISKNILPYIYRSDKFEIGTVSDPSTELRERYASAKRPALEQLVGKTFQCVNYSATLVSTRPPELGIGKPIKGTFQIFKDPKIPNVLVISHPGYRDDGMQLGAHFINDWSGAQQCTDIKEMIVYSSVRFEKSSGKFLLEFSVMNPELQYGVPYLNPISYFGNYNVKVWHYGICDAS